MDDVDRVMPAVSQGGAHCPLNCRVPRATDFTRTRYTVGMYMHAHLGG